MNKWLLLFFLVCSAGKIALGQTTSDTLRFTLNFASDKSDLTEEHRLQLEQYTSLIQQTNVQLLEIRITGHTDYVGSLAYNQALSQRRAESIRLYFVEQNISENLLQITFNGEEQPIANNTTTQGRQQNRRVEVAIFYHKKSPPPPLDTISVDALTGEPVTELFKKLALPPQEFCINPRKDTTLVCEKGTLIVVKAYTFSTKNKKVPCITFQVLEAFYKSEMILNNLSTMSNGQIIETQGMVYINAMEGEDTLAIKRGEDIKIIMPIDKIVSGAKIFEGERDPLHNDAVNWTVANNSALSNFTIQQVSDCSDWFNQGLNYENFRQDPRYANYLYGALENECKGCGLGCRTKRGVKGIFNKEQRKRNKEYRKCRRRVKKLKRLLKIRGWFMRFCSTIMPRGRGRRSRQKKNKKKLNTQEQKKLDKLVDEMMESDIKAFEENFVSEPVFNKCSELDSLFHAYEVDDVPSLILALNQPLMDRFGVSTIQELRDTLPKANLANVELAYRNQSLSYDDFKFYIYNTTKLGWKNIDEFAKIPEDKKVDLRVDLKPAPQTDCKLVFKEREFVLSAELEDLDHQTFIGVPIGEKAWIVAIQYDNNQPKLGLKEIIVSDELFTVELETYTLEELREELKKIDFKEQ